MKITALDSKSHGNSDAANEVRSRRILSVAMLIAVIAGSLISGAADARPIRFDQSGSWVPENGDTSANANLGFEFDLFGVPINSVFINPAGFISFGGTITVSTKGQSFAWQTQETDGSFGFDSELVDGFRVTFGVGDEERAMQIGLFELINDVFVIEFNYGVNNLLAQSFIGYDNGAGSVYNLLQPGNPDLAHGCEAPSPSHKVTESFCFDPALSALGFSQETVDYFTKDFDNPTNDAIGRYFFVIDGNTTAVPEPGTGALLLVGLGALGALRRRRTTAKVD